MNELSGHEKTEPDMHLLSKRHWSERPYTIWSLQCDTLEMVKLWRQYKDQWLPGAWG